MPKRIAILGSTGSIGCNALDVVAALGPDYSVTALSAGRNCAKLLEQVRLCRPAAVAIADHHPDPAVVAELKSLGVSVSVGPESLVEIATRDDVDIVLAAVVGAAGLPAVIAAVRAGKTLALANKESLVVAGSILMPEARARGVPVLPVDSEHSAIFQAMRAGSPKEVAHIVLTASGGPFRTWPRERIEDATLEDALRHPTWRMGNKITIDSATMFNKALEIIEARWLFDLPAEQIRVVIHPESVVHSLVEFVDGSVIAQLSPPDMRTPIQYALTYPERTPGPARRMDWKDKFTLHFEPPDPVRFPALSLAYDAVRSGGTMGAVLNAANEAAVELFASGKIAFGEISRLVGFTMGRHSVQTRPSLDDLLEADRWARQAVLEKSGQRVLERSV
ncbi:1-deoxy-D-xylulose-5-phosphate reductoisomerase [Humisphaera borealis]|uniref:1-deoxy-D-xylulose-5-phosphate reductoisomerase n=1 Tax=Humisphaera borealis TaxID=2807512 RepID=UPI0019D27E4E|nr:1-deoxy-D-xylulose-5-phosphate reductoisomerase [Humisphaera borealis]